MQFHTATVNVSMNVILECDIFLHEGRPQDIQ